MTAKSYVLDDRGNPKKMPGWFSWRHPTPEPMLAARERYRATKSREARRRRAKERQERAS